MILLDTNVISELMRTQPEPAVISWLDGQAAESVWITSVTVFEVHTGIEILDEGKRKRILREKLGELLSEVLMNRVADLNTAAAQSAAVITATARREGRPIEVRDAMIAGIARHRRAALATRNTKHFEHAGITVVNPWIAEQTT